MECSDVYRSTSAVSEAQDNTYFRPRFPVLTGGFSDIYRGTFNGELAAIKCIRITDSLPRERQMGMRKRLLVSAKNWESLNHLNVAAVKIDDDSKDDHRVFPHIISPWYEQGGILDYLSSNPGADRLKLIKGITNALSYLHDHDIVHGNLYPGNVLIDDSGRAVLTDYGLAAIYDLQHYSAFSNPDGPRYRYTAPECVNGINEYILDAAGDVWSLACVSLEIQTNIRPFEDVISDVAVFLALYDHQKPYTQSQKPPFVSGHTDSEIWDLMFTCMQVSPSERPTINHLHGYLSRIITAVQTDGISSGAIPSVRATVKNGHEGAGRWSRL